VAIAIAAILVLGIILYGPLHCHFHLWHGCWIALFNCYYVYSLFSTLICSFCTCIYLCSVPYEYLAHTCIWVIPYACGLLIRVRAIFHDPYAYWLPVRVWTAHTSIAGNHWFACMRICARTCMGQLWVSLFYGTERNIPWHYFPERNDFLLLQ